jgi:hypothetical protein
MFQGVKRHILGAISANLNALLTVEQVVEFLASEEILAVRSKTQFYSHFFFKQIDGFNYLLADLICLLDCELENKNQGGLYLKMYVSKR